MTFPIPNYSRIWVRGRFVDLSKAAQLLTSYGMTGPVKFTPSPRVLLDVGTKQIISTSEFVVTPSATDGYFAINLPATDDPDINPVGWTYSVTEPTGRSYNIVVPIATPVLSSPGDPLDGQRVIELVSVVPAPAPNAGSVQLILGATGRGIASMTVNGSGDLIVTYTDGGTGNLGPIPPVTKATLGLGNVDNTSDVNKPVSTATEAAYRRKGSTIRPDQFTGTDAQKLQAAVNYCIANSYPTIILDRMLDLTGAGPISVDKAFWYRRESLTFEGTGGGIIKNSAGVVFTSATPNTGDLTFHKVKYVSTAGAGAVLMDCDKLLRCFSSGCEYRNWDMIVRQLDPTRWTQSMRYTNEKIVGGVGPAFYYRECYDVTLDNILCEDRSGVGGGLIANSDGTSPAMLNRALRITNTVVENCSGIPIKLAMSWPLLIQGCYFEQNGGPTDPQIDLYSLATLSVQAGTTLLSNMITQKQAQRDSKVGAILLGLGRPKDVVSSIGNTLESGILYQFGGATGLVHGIGDVVEGTSLVVYPGQEHRYFTDVVKPTTTAARPKNPRIGDGSYFDTDVTKLIVAKTAGTKGIVSFRVSAGATTSGNLTLTIASKVFPPVAVVAGDTITQVRNKLVAAASTYFPDYKLAAVSTNFAQFDALAPGRLAGVQSLNAGGTGVATDYFQIDVLGTDPVWVEQLGGLNVTATVDFASIAAGGVGESAAITVTGAAVGDRVSVGPPATIEAGLAGWSGYVSAANTVKIRIANHTGAAIDPASATWTVAIVR
jgi:hypothetical protein